MDCKYWYVVNRNVYPRDKHSRGQKLGDCIESNSAIMAFAIACERMAQFVYDNCPSSKEWAKEYYNRGR